jgi:hypothetical protein
MTEIRLQTAIDKDAVLYGVMVNNVCVWSKEVGFSMKGRNRAGGPAFVQAAREQEAIARTYAEKAEA